MAQSQPTADELRQVAAFVAERSEATAETTAETTPAQPELAIGNLQQFPQPAPEDRVSASGASLDEAEQEPAQDQIIADLLDLAAAMDAGREVSPRKLRKVRRYIDEYRAEQS